MRKHRDLIKTYFSGDALLVAMAGIVVLGGLVSGGCQPKGLKEYSNEWLYPEDVSTVYVEMFDSSGFRRGHEYTLTDAICKRIEANTPYKIVSDRDAADTLLRGRLTIGAGILAGERYQGTTLESESLVTVTVSWKNLRTGDLLINDEEVTASASFSSQLGQDFEYAARVGLNMAAQRVVELMEKKW